MPRPKPSRSSAWRPIARLGTRSRWRARSRLCVRRPARIAAAALEEGVHVIGLSILSGSHRAQVAEVLARLRAEGLDDLPVVVGGIIPAEDAAQLRAAGVAGVFTPKDYDLAEVMAEIVGMLEGEVDKAA